MWFYHFSQVCLRTREASSCIILSTDRTNPKLRQGAPPPPRPPTAPRPPALPSPPLPRSLGAGTSSSQRTPLLGQVDRVTSRKASRKTTPRGRWTASRHGRLLGRPLLGAGGPRHGTAGTRGDHYSRQLALGLKISSSDLISLSSI